MFWCFLFFISVPTITFAAKNSKDVSDIFWGSLLGGIIVISIIKLLEIGLSELVDFIFPSTASNKQKSKTKRGRKNET